MKITSIIRNVGIKVFPAFVFLVTLLTGVRVYASAEYKMPDFAFPQTVMEQRDSTLHISLARHNDVETLRSVMNLIIARNLLMNSEGVAGNISLLDSVEPYLSDLYKRLDYLLEADVLCREYMSRRGVYDSRNLPVTLPFPEDPTEWSGTMFKEKIFDLVSKAGDRLEDLSSAGIDDISPLLTDMETAMQIHLTVPMFIAFKGAQICADLSSSYHTVIPFYPHETATSAEGKFKAEGKALLSVIVDSLASDNSVMKALAMQKITSFVPGYETNDYLNGCWSQLKDSEGSGIILYELWNRSRSGDSDEGTGYYTAIKEWLNKFPKGYGEANLRYAVQEMEKETVRAEFPTKSLPLESISGKVTVTNLQKTYLLVFKLNSLQYDSYDNLIVKKLPKGSKPYKVVEVTEADTDSFKVPYKYEKEVNLEGLAPGLYAIIPSKGKTLPGDWGSRNSNYQTSSLRVSEISVLTFIDATEKNSGRVYVVKGKNQQPVEGASVSYYQGASNVAKGKGVTNKDGWISVPSGYYNIRAVYGANEAVADGSFSYYPAQDYNQERATIFPDMSVYRPGDTIRYAVVGWKQVNQENSLLKNRDIVITLRDANYQIVNSDTLELNDQGRAWGEILIPKGRLLGNYQLSAVYPGKKEVSAGVISVMVEEYKVPGFLVTVSQEESLPDSLVFKGMAQTYTALPITDAKVTVSVSYLPWRWGWPNINNARFSTETVTDSQGCFIITLPVNSLKGTPFAQGRYSITAEAASSSGETVASQPLFFYLGKGFDIRPSVADKIEIKGDSVTFNIPVYDMAGIPQQVEIDYRIINLGEKKDTIAGSFKSPLLSLPSNRLPSSKYNLEFKQPSDTVWTSTETIIWRKADTTAPYQTSLWIPETEYIYKEGEKVVEITFGSYWKDWILLVISDDRKILKTEWIAPSDSLKHYRVDIPEGNPTLFVSLSGLHNLAGERGEIKIMTEKRLEKMEIETVSFRDKVTAGDHETWTFRFKSNLGMLPRVNAFAVMTDKAMNAIQEFKWDWNIWKPLEYNKVRISLPYLSTGYTFGDFSRRNVYPISLTPIPDWQTYGYSWSSSFPMPYSRGVMLRSAKAVQNAAIADAKAEMAMEDSAELTMEESTQAGESAEASEREEYRPVEMPVAFFMPDLQTDENGFLDLNITVPNFNTTWQLQVAGYTDQLLNAVAVFETVASKSVMVKSNLPQFLRTGDKAEISATLFNNTSEAIPIEGSIGISDPATGKILASRDFTPETVEATANRVISIAFQVPYDIMFVEVRAFAKGASHTDGEKGIIAVLPSSTPVIESSTFYVKSQDTTFEMKIPEIRKGANVTLKYCSNPLWEVLLSLPSSDKPLNASSLAIARWLYSTMTSLDIIQNSQALNQGLEAIFNSEDSALTVSKLQKEGYLKLAQLEATPWINNASAETMRIQGLKKYLQPDEVLTGIDTQIQALRNLQGGDGGWCWFPGMSSSPYITSKIIEIFGSLKEQNLMTPELEKMAVKSVRYYDTWLKEQKKKNSDLNYLSTMRYLYYRNMLGVSKDSGMKTIEKTTLDSVVKNWRFFDAGQKAMAAMLLQESSYKKESETILASLNQFVDSKIPLWQQAMMLAMFRKTGQYPEAVEKLKERILLSKETQEWGDEFGDCTVISVLLKSFDNSSFTQEIPSITINGKPISLSPSQALTGSFTVNLDAKKVSGATLRITRKAGVPSWGGVITQYVAPIQEVKGTSVENLSIRKEIYKEDYAGNLSEVIDLQKGDKVRVVLKLDCGKDMDYVVIADSRTACLQPDNTSSGIVMTDGILAYREVQLSRISYFLENVPAGKYVISYTCHADREGEYSSGIAEVQCLYSPAQVSHTSGSELKVSE